MTLKELQDNLVRVKSLFEEVKDSLKGLPDDDFGDLIKQDIQHAIEDINLARGRIQILREWGNK